MKKAALLRQLISTPSPEFLMEAHNGLSAKIVERAGFKGIWASGLSISASLGVRDANEASWTQTLDVVEFMCDSTDVPILLDGDTGHGNFNNVRRFVRKAEQLGIAGVCIEDKVFPKANSFVESGSHGLADVMEFCSRIEAAKDAQADDDFVVVARTEALVLGAGQREALKRAEAYRRAGADAILIHSKESTVAEIEAFARAWGNRAPLVVVPTKYYKTPPQKFADMNISLVIWANHMMRSAVSIMERMAAKIFEQQSIAEAESEVAPLSRVFELQNLNELAEAEERYLRTTDSTRLRASTESVRLMAAADSAARLLTAWRA
jgi:phosphoenolpyruvate phosphomutase